MSFASLMNQTATISSQTPTVDDLGGRVEGTVATSTVACRVRALSGHERGMSGSEGTDISHRMYCVPCTITEQDRVTINSVVYEVEFINRLPGGASGHHYEIDLREYRREIT